MMVTHKEAIEAIKTVEKYCHERSGCSKCVFCTNGFCGWTTLCIADDAEDELKQLEAEEK